MWYALSMLSLRAPLVLGSKSPRRSELLDQIGLSFFVRPAEVDESSFSGEMPESYVESYVERIALAKLNAVAHELENESKDWCAVLVADTSVSLAGSILGKPQDLEDSLRMVSRLAGTSHEVFTCYGLEERNTQRRVFRTVRTLVTMRQASQLELAAYVETGEGMDKAGAYGIQGGAACLIQGITGSYSNVVGLPLCELVVDLGALSLLENSGAG